MRLAPDATVESADEWVAARQAEISRGVDVLAIMALLFVAIALFVGVMVIANTFSILFAQRMRDFALLRCVGVTRRQLRRAVRLEALVLGLAASTLGLAAGAGDGVRPGRAGAPLVHRHGFRLRRPGVGRDRIRTRRGRHGRGRLAPHPRGDEGRSAGGAAARHRRRGPLDRRPVAPLARRTRPGDRLRAAVPGGRHRHPPRPRRHARRRRRSPSSGCCCSDRSSSRD